MRWLFALVLMTTSAAGAPRPFLATPGIQLTATATSGAFCETSQRAVFRLNDGSLIAITANGAIQKLGSMSDAIGVLACDKNDRIIGGASTSLVVFDNGAITTETLTSGVRYLRPLDDGTMGVVDVNGGVYRYSTTLTKEWTTGRNMFQPFDLDGTGEKIVTISGGAVEIIDRNGRRKGPVAVSAAWSDNSTVIFGTRTGALGRWTFDAAVDKHTMLDGLPNPGTTFTRTLFQRAGNRIVVQRTDGPILAVHTTAKPVMISRLPGGRRVLAAGSAPYGVMVVNDRAFIFDLTKSTYAVDHQRAVAPVDAMAFSPDGRFLAMLGGDRDVIVSSVDRSTFRRLQTTTFVRGPLVWAPDGTIIAASPTGHVRWNLDNTVELRADRTVGFTPNGGAITLARDQRLAIERGRSEQLFAISPASSVMQAALTDRYLLVRTPKRAELYALTREIIPALRTRDRSFLRDAVLVGDDSIMTADETGMLALVDAKGERELERYAGVQTLVVSPDHKRVALADNTTVAVWDHRGQLVAKTTMSARVHSVAWSPDLRTLAIATRDGVELWTVPIDARL